MTPLPDMEWWKEAIVNEFPEDPELERLRARMGAADPAADLPSADHAEVARLMEDTMNTTTDRRRSPFAIIAVAAAVILLAGVGFFALNGGNDDDPVAGKENSTPTQTTEGPETTDAGSTLSLTASGPGNGRCQMPTVKLLRDLVAFSGEGTVTSIEDGVVTIEIDQVYVGDEVDTVTVDQPSETTNTLLLGVDFEEGEKYVVSANSDGDLLICGMSGPYDGRLATMIGKAFPQR